MKINRIFLAMLVSLIIGATSINAQVNIGSTDAPHGSAVLDLSNANNLGLLLPRATLTGPNDNTTISGTTNGLMVYNSGLNSGLAAGVYVWHNGRWYATTKDTPVITFRDITKTTDDAGQNIPLSAEYTPGPAPTPTFTVVEKTPSNATVIVTGTNLNFSNTTTSAQIKVTYPETDTHSAASAIATLTVTAPAPGAKLTPTITFPDITKTTSETGQFSLTSSSTYTPDPAKPAAIIPNPKFTVVSCDPVNAVLYVDATTVYITGTACKAKIQVDYDETDTHYAAKAIATLTVATKVTNVKVERESGTGSINVGETLKLKATVEPSSADQSVIWSVSGPVAYVDQTGLVKGIEGGIVTVTATSKVDPAISSSPYSVTVNVPPRTDGEYLDNVGTGGPYKVYSGPDTVGIWTENIREPGFGAVGWNDGQDGSRGYFYAKGQAAAACESLGKGYHLPTAREWQSLMWFATLSNNGFAAQAHFLNSGQMAGYKDDTGAGWKERNNYVRWFIAGVKPIIQGRAVRVNANSMRVNEGDTGNGVYTVRCVRDRRAP